MSSNQYTVNIVNADELYIGGRKIQALELGVLVSDDASYGIGIGTDKPRLKLDISGADGIRIPVGTTGERPINDTFLVANGVAAPNGAKNLLGILRYNTTTEKYEAVCDSENLTADPSWCNFVIETGTNVGNNKVGINTGTVTPSQTLDVSGQIGINDYIIHNGDTNNTKIGFPTNDTLTITTGGTERMRVDPSGNVGIGTTGTTNPKGNLHVFNSTLNTTSDLLSTSINRWTNAPSLTTDIYYNYLENTLVSSESPDWSTVPRYGFKLGSWRNSISSGLILKTINSATIDWKTTLKINHNGFFYFNSPDSHLEKFYSPYHFSFKPIGNGKYGDQIPTNSKINDLTFSNFSTAQTETKNIFGEYPVFIGKGCSLYSDASPNLENTKFIAFSEEGSSGSQNFYGGGIMLNDKIHFITYNKIQTASVGLTDSAGNTITDGAELQLSTYTRMTIDETGNVGIGVTLPYSKFTIGFKDTTTQDSTNLSTSGITAAKCYIGIGKQEYLDEHKKLIGFGYVSSSSNYYPAYIGYQEKNTSSNTYGDLIFGTRSSTSQSVEPTERMRIRYDGNVGIGTTSPDAKLQVNGDFHIEGTSNAWTSGMGKGLYFRFHNGNADGYIQCMDRTNNTYYGLQFDALDYNFRTNGVTKMFIKQDGNVGIGTTSPTQTLDVNGAIGMAHYIYHNGDTNTYFGFPTTDAFAVTTSGTERMRIDSAGNVGIGTTSPGSALHIKNNFTTTPIALKIESHGQNDSKAKIELKSIGSGGGYVSGYISQGRGGSVGGHEYYIGMGGGGDGNSLAVTNGGRVGIGTLSPGYTLDVNGNCRINSTLRVQNAGTPTVEMTNANSGTYGSEAHVKIRLTYGHGNGRWIRMHYHHNDEFSWAWQAERSGSSVGNWIYFQHRNNIGSSGYRHTSFYIHGTNSKVYFQNGHENSSDRRIKKDIIDVPDDLSLDLLRNIPVRYYNYIEEHLNKESPHQVIGFIAQEVNDVFPIAVTDNEIKVIPSENRMLNNFLLEELIDISSNTIKYKLYTDISCSKGDIYKFHLHENLEDFAKDVLAVCDGGGVFIYTKNNEYAFSNKYRYIFVEGKEINDFHFLDKGKLFALNFSATQEIDKIQQVEKTKLAAAETKLAAAETKLAAAETEIATLKTTLTDVLARLAALELN